MCTGVLQTTEIFRTVWMKLSAFRMLLYLHAISCLKQGSARAADNVWAEQLATYAQLISCINLCKHVME